jgi:predicted unusual protein kinase regulating ubiquinone biosynthesis (AarF/ABC1/UbiB family)
METLSTRERMYRARRIGTTFGRVYLGIKAHQFLQSRLRPSDMRERWSRFNRSSAESIYATAVDLRGLILKGCQFLGSRSDVLPREYVEVLSKLQDRVPAKPFRVVKRMVEDELGRPLDEVFEAFAERPIASASLAQVHEAKLRGGERVAVKVQYPEVAALVESDLANLRVLFRAVGVLERNVDLMPLIEELGTYVPRELDFVNEADNAEAAARQFENRDDVRVPRIHRELTTRRVLVMEFIDGIKITDVDALARADVDVQRVVQTLIEAYCEQILVHGFFHADPHPGNLLVEPGSSRLVMLDFGLAKDLPKGFREAVVRLAVALLQDDADGLSTALFDMGFETRTGEREALAEAARFFLDFAKRFRERPFADPRMFESLNDELPEMMRNNPIVRVPSHVVLLGRVLGLLSGVSRTLGSRVDLLRTLMPYVLGARPPGSQP